MTPRVGNPNGPSILAEVEPHRRCATRRSCHPWPEVPRECLGDEIHRRVAGAGRIRSDSRRHDGDGRSEPVTAFAVWEAQDPRSRYRVIADERLRNAVHQGAPPMAAREGAPARGEVLPQRTADASAFKA